MKQSFFIGFSLTLLALTLVTVATIAFLAQNRTQLLEDVATLEDSQDGLQTELMQQSVEISNAQATSTAIAASFVTMNAAIATQSAENADLNSELVASGLEAQALEVELSTRAEELSEVNALYTDLQLRYQGQRDQPPLVEIVSPSDGAVIPAQTPVEVIVVASHPFSLTAVNVSIDELPFSSHDVADQPLFVSGDVWTPLSVGVHTISAMAINSWGQASEPVTTTVEVIAVSNRDQNNQTEAAIETEVTKIRGLTLLTPVQPKLLTSSELSERFAFGYNSDDASKQGVLILSAFDFVEPDFDLEQALLELPSDGISGFYDPATGEFVVISNDLVLDPIEQLTHVHELAHALQDQYYNLDRLSSEAATSEAQIALRALAEGEAELVQYLFYMGDYFSDEEKQQIQTLAATNSEPIPANVPPFLINRASFPYEAGFEFAVALYNGGQPDVPGDFSRLDEAWRNPPISTEQILHPQRYLEGDMPLDVTIPSLTDTLGDEWQQIDQAVFGEFSLREYVGQQLDALETTTAVTGWGGDQYVIYWRETDDSLIMALRIRWDSLNDSNEFNELYSQYPARLLDVESVPQANGSRCWVGSETICLYPMDEETLIVRTPDLNMATMVIERIYN